MTIEPHKGTQEERILKALKKNKCKGLTALDAMQMKPGIFRLAARVLELKRKGWDIENVGQPKASGGTCGRYVLRVQ